MKLTRSDHWTALAAAAIMVGGALVVFFNRYSHLVKRLPGVLLWDSNVFAAAGRMVAQGLNPYLAPVIDNPSPLPFISAPQVAIVLGGLAHVMGPALFALLTLCHIAALILTPLILSRLFLGKDWKDAALGYGLFACGLGAFGVAVFAVRLALPLFAHRVSEWQMMVTAMITTGVMLFLFPLTHHVPLLVLMAFLLGIGLGGAQPMIMTLLYQHAPPGRGGEAVGMRTLLININQTGIPLMFGALGAALGMTPVFWTMAILLAGSGYLMRKP